MPGSLFDHRPRIRSIASEGGFVDALALGLLAEAGGDPLALSRFLILLPNRRGCRALQDAFLRLSEGGGEAVLLLPRLMPLGDLDEAEIALREAGLGEAVDLPPAIAPLRRQWLLARLIARKAESEEGAPMRFAQALALAGELARLFDQVETEGLDFKALDHLVDDEPLARHWQIVRRFLDIVAGHWPEILATEGALDPATRRNRLLYRQADLWRRSPPDHPVIVAGSTGSIPASAELMKAVAGLPRGLIVLPGLDREATEETWQAIGEDPSHPQFGFASLLAKLEIDRRSVGDWPDFPIREGWPAALATRRRIVAAALLPAKETRHWLALKAGIDRESAAIALQSVRRIDAESEGEEAGIIALRLREAAEEKAPYSAALVTPDRALARRVAAELGRWGIAIDDSAGRSLALTGPGGFFLAVAEALAENLAPIPLLTLLKHDLATGGLAPGHLAAESAALEMAILRGPRPQEGLAGLAAALEAKGDEAPPPARDLLARLQSLLAAAPSLDRRHPPRLLLEAQTRIAEALAADDREAGAERLWRGEAGEALADFVGEFAATLGDMPDLGWRDYADALAATIASIEVRPRYGLHPRLFIWGPLEARLQQVDLMILGGLNEGTWPSLPPADPWMSRSMRRRFGLLPAERRIGLAAHDFAQAMNAREILLTRSQRSAGAPTTPSRWLSRLDAFQQILELPQEQSANSYSTWQAAIDRPAFVRPIARPQPVPGARYRPQRLSVTEVETLRRDPYAIYARKILRLRKLPAIDEEPDRADFGSLVHDFLAECARRFPATLPAEASGELRRIADSTLAPFSLYPGLAAFWRPRLMKILPWVLERWESERDVAHRFAECRGTYIPLKIEPPFTLTARADRIDRLKDGRLRILDYKTGTLPKKRDLENGIAPQLPLEALIAAHGGFEGIDAAAIAELLYIRFPAGRETPSEEEVSLDLIDRAEADLLRAIDYYAREDAAYIAIPDDSLAPAYNDYDHLERVDEWRKLRPDDEGDI